jgi:serine/threonine protein phosphatase 1
LIGRLFRRKSSEAPPSTGGRLVYAIGDVHGRLDALQPLLRDIAADALVSRPSERPLLVFLGDYVDRGPDSRGVVDQVLALIKDGGFEVAALKGNHEDALLQFLGDTAIAVAWMENGGGATLISYGVEPAALRMDAEGWDGVRDAFEAALPAEHQRFYESLQTMRIVGDYAFVHAGVRPGVPLEAQAEEDLLWIRYEFLESPGPFGKVIVHGHTPSLEPQMLRHRLGLDTGAYFTGVLTAVRLHGEDQRLIQARAQRGD